MAEKLSFKLSPEAKLRLKWMDYYHQTKNISLTCRHFGISRNTFYYWKRRYKPFRLLTLETRKRKPSFMPHETGPDVKVKIVQLKNNYPRYGQKKIQIILLRDYGVKVGATTIYRLCKKRNLIKVYKRKSNVLRIKKGVVYTKPGENIQIDTKHLIFPNGIKYYQFSAIDVVTRLKVAYVYRQSNQKNAIKFLEYCQLKFPFNLSSIQTDNGSEYQSLFDRACKKLGLAHYYTYPRTPEQNGKVENSHGIDEREFYSLGNLISNLYDLNLALKQHLEIRNTFRPHQALNYLTPMEYYLTNFVKTKV